MSEELPRKLDEIVCTLLPVTEFDASTAPEKRGPVPIGGFTRPEIIHDTVEIDFAQATLSKKLDLERRAPAKNGTDAVRLPQDLHKAILALAEICYAARREKTTFPPEAAQLLAELAQAPSPLNAASFFLQAVAARQPLPPVPADLPLSLVNVLAALAERCGKP